MMRDNVPGRSQGPFQGQDHDLFLNHQSPDHGPQPLQCQETAIHPIQVHSHFQSAFGNIVSISHNDNSTGHRDGKTCQGNSTHRILFGFGPIVIKRIKSVILLVFVKLHKH